MMRLVCFDFDESCFFFWWSDNPNFMIYNILGNHDTQKKKRDSPKLKQTNSTILRFVYFSSFFFQGANRTNEKFCNFFFQFRTSQGRKYHNQLFPGT